MDDFITFDIETTNWINFSQAGYYDGSFYTDKIYTPLQLYKRLFQMTNAGKNIYAHFGGRFDFRFILDIILDKNTEVNIIDANGRILFINVKNKDGTYKLIDSANLLPISLKKITESFNVRHAKGFIDFSKEQYNKKSPKHREYLKNDVIGLYESLKKFSTWGSNDGNLSDRKSVV